MSYQPIWTAPRDGTWVRLYASGLGVTSHPVRWRTAGTKPGWYSARGARMESPIFDSWLPAKGAAPAWCEVLGVDRTATRGQIVAAYKSKAKLAHPDVGGSHEAMQTLTQARDAALEHLGS
jgi:hypothetical protein